MNDPGTTKAELRARLRAAVKSIGAEERAAAASAVVERISEERRWREARTVMLFVPLGDEPDILPLLNEALDHKKTVLLPRHLGGEKGYEAAVVSNLTTDLVRGPFGVTEPSPDCPPCPLNRLDVTLVPGLGFDPVGRRLGRGRGHYDRLLAGATGWIWGIGFDCQVISELPLEAHDVVLNCIVTPARWIEAVSARR